MWSNKTHTKEQQAADVKSAAVVGVGAIIIFSPVDEPDTSRLVDLR